MNLLPFFMGNKARNNTRSPPEKPRRFVQTAAGLSSCPMVQYGRNLGIMDTNEFNPYAPPQAMMGSGGSVVGTCYRQGMLLVVPRSDAPYFPCDSCVKCGQPAVSTLRRKLAWHHPAWYFLILVNLLVFVIVAVCVSKKMTLTVGLCEKHRAGRKAWILASWFCLAAGIAFCFVFGSSDSRDSLYLIFLGGGCIVLSLVFACVVSYIIVRPSRITESECTLRGAGEVFLQQFPSA